VRVVAQEQQTLQPGRMQQLRSPHNQDHYHTWLVESKYTEGELKCILYLVREQAQQLEQARVLGNQSQESHRDLPGFGRKGRRAQQSAKWQVASCDLALHLATLGRFLRSRLERDR